MTARKKKVKASQKGADAFKKKAQEYADAMVRGDFAALGDEGIKALRQITNYAGLPSGLVNIDGAGLPRNIDTTNDPAPSANAGNIPVPGVTVFEDGRERHYDLLSLLVEKRIVLLAGEVNDSMALVACASLLYLDKAHKEAGKEIQVIVNSPGGSVLAGLSIYDTMQNITSPIKTAGVGLQASMGSILLAAGAKRLMTPNSKLMIHQISSGARGQASDLVLSIDFSNRLHDDLKDIYVRHIGLNHKFWDKALERDTWLTADQALKMGFITMIDKDKKVAPYAKDALKRKFENAQKRDDKIPKTLMEIETILNDMSSNGSEWAPYRPELIVALSQYPKYWTEGKKEKMAADGYIVPADDVMFTGVRKDDMVAQDKSGNVVDLTKFSKEKSKSKKQGPSA